MVDPPNHLRHRRYVEAFDFPSATAACPMQATDDGALLIDESGNIRSCGTAACDMFGGTLGEISGKPISSLISDFLLPDASLRYSVRCNFHLCATQGWRRCEAVDIHGNTFSVEINLSKMDVEGRRLFLLNLRRVKVAAT